MMNLKELRERTVIYQAAHKVNICHRGKWYSIITNNLQALDSIWFWEKYGQKAPGLPTPNQAYQALRKEVITKYSLK